MYNIKVIIFLGDFMKENIYRTHNCGQLRIENVGEDVRLAGFVDTIRKLGSITFVTLRDYFGITQLLINDQNAE